MKKWLLMLGIGMLSISCTEKKNEKKALGFTEPPKWAREAVWYQIFPERFRNGDSENDPSWKDIQGSWDDPIPKSWKVKSWTSDWYEADDWEKESGTGFYSPMQ
ncbi:MAG: hypothetical protein MI784_04145, partial [Cytophagales bacterium]|nr:hypothetical protein [Cytophagales bacterium]